MISFERGEVENNVSAVPRFPIGSQPACRHKDIGYPCPVSVGNDLERAAGFDAVRHLAGNGIDDHDDAVREKPRFITA